jgi:hypothetical protein
MALKLVADIAAGASRVIDATEGFNLSVITGAGTTATIRRVDDMEAGDPGAHAADVAVAAASMETVLVDWPYYRVAAVGGVVRVALV